LIRIRTVRDSEKKLRRVSCAGSRYSLRLPSFAGEKCVRRAKRRSRRSAAFVESIASVRHVAVVVRLGRCDGRGRGGGRRKGREPHADSRDIPDTPAATGDSSETAVRLARPSGRNPTCASQNINVNAEPDHAA